MSEGEFDGVDADLEKASQNPALQGVCLLDSVENPAISIRALPDLGGLMSDSLRKTGYPDWPQRFLDISRQYFGLAAPGLPDPEVPADHASLPADGMRAAENHAEQCSAQNQTAPGASR